MTVVCTHFPEFEFQKHKYGDNNSQRTKCYVPGRSMGQNIMNCSAKMELIDVFALVVVQSDIGGLH